jgi:hypothetical protein
MKITAIVGSLASHLKKLNGFDPLSQTQSLFAVAMANPMLGVRHMA